MTDEEKAREFVENKRLSDAAKGYDNLNVYYCGIEEGILYGLSEGRKESAKDLQTAIKANNAWLKKDTALEEENERLKADLEEAWSHCKVVDDVNEKMKCCENCKHIRYDYEYSFCELNKNGLYPCVNRDKWELKE